MTSAGALRFRAYSIRESRAEGGFLFRTHHPMLIAAISAQ